MRHHVFVIVVAIAAASTLNEASAAAQNSNFALVEGPTPPRAGGWTFTPWFAYQGSWDDNVLLRGRGDQTVGGFFNLVNPRADLNFLGRRGEFDASYDGAFLLYPGFNTLNSYDQHGTVVARRLVTPHIAVFVHDTAAAVPTTELVQFIAVPFVRTGSKLNDLRGGIEAALSKYTSVTATYHFEWVQFDPIQPFGFLLRGGHSHGGSVGLRRRLTETTTLQANYNLQHALIVYSGTFDVTNADVGVEHAFSPSTRVFAAAGVSRLGISRFGPARTGPAWRVGLSHRYRNTAVNASYSRSYVPAFGFGGTYQNEEVAAHVHAPLTRRLYVQAGASWRRNEPLTQGELRLKSFWAEGVLGYAAQPWLRLEAFYSGTHQKIDRPGGVFDRNRVGFQIVTSKPMRVH